MVVATLAEQTVGDNLVNVQLIEYRVGVLAETGCEDDDFVDFAHLLQKVVNTRPLEDVEMMPVVLYLDWDNKVRLLYRLHSVSNRRHQRKHVGGVTDLETTVYKGFVEVEHQALAAGMLGCDGREEGFGIPILCQSGQRGGRVECGREMAATHRTYGDA